VNKCFLYGNIAATPELKTTSNGFQVASFSLATNERRKTEAGDSITETTWHKVIVWGKQGENCNKYLTKGSSALVEGKIVNRSYEDTQGQKRFVSEVVASQVTFGSRGAGDSAPSGPLPDAFGQGDILDNIPF
jgi:single-strand DNA-binding protein